MDDTQPSVTSLVTAPPPPAHSNDLEPDQLEQYVLAAMHQDRVPGNLLVVRHPLRTYKVPRHLLPALRHAGFHVEVAETRAERVESVRGIRDAMLRLSEEDKPLDILAITGDGSLDHHVMVAAWWAFYPDLVHERPGAVDVSAVTQDDLASLPAEYRRAFFRRLPDTSSLEPDHATIVEIWLLRTRLETALRKGRPVTAILRRSRREPDDLVLQVAVLAALLPHRVVLRRHGFDLSGLATAPQEETFQGLYPFIRSIAVYPAGTAADNAVFSGVPGWLYAQASKVLTRVSWLDGVRARAEEGVTAAFMDYFLKDSVVVPARQSVVGLDGDWQMVSSHAAGGPAAGYFFTTDLVSHTGSLVGYLVRIPGMVLREGVLGSTVVRLVSRMADGTEKTRVEAHMGEGLYTNRTFIAGVGSVPTTEPVSFAGQSSLLIIPPVWALNEDGGRTLNWRTLAAFGEGILKGIGARTLHLLGLNVGKLAGGGKLSMLLPEHQVAIKEGEEIDIHYLTMDKDPRAVSVQVSGDPFQAWRMHIRVLWGPIPLLGKGDSLLLASTRRSLANLRMLQSYKLQGAYIGGMYYFRHHVGQKWTAEFTRRTGLLRPPLHLPRQLARIQRLLIRAWQSLGTGDFVDTSESGLKLGRRGRYAHNNDQSAHLVVLRQRMGTLLVRQVRTMAEGAVYETRTHYRPWGASWIIYTSQTRLWLPGEDPRILQEDHFFRNAESFQVDAPTFFPFVSSTPGDRTLLGPPEITDERPRSWHVKE